MFYPSIYGLDLLQRKDYTDPRDISTANDLSMTEKFQAFK